MESVEKTINNEEKTEEVEEVSLDIDPVELMKQDADVIRNYVTKIQTLLKQQQQEISTLKALLNENAVVAVENGAKDNELQKEEAEKDSAADADAFVTEAFSLVDEMREAALLAKNFIYEPTSGLYYDQKTGYYYNAEYKLYYDGNTGCYYSYNEQKDAYEFHSQVQVQPNQKTDDPLTDTEEQIEFDEWGGVITDKDLLSQIKKEKNRVLEKEKKKRKKSKHEKKRKHKHRKHYINEQQEDGELSSSESSASDENSEHEKDKNQLADDALEDVPMFERSNKFQGVL